MNTKYKFNESNRALCFAFPSQAVGEKFYKQMLVDSEYTGADYDEFAAFLAQNPKTK